jgi:mono/diheme cytochrome c family protein
MRKLLKPLQLVMIIGVLTASLALGSGLAQSPPEGAAIFDEKCAGCHSVGGGDLVGPDLAGVTQRRNQQWLIDFLSDPEKILDSGDPTASELLAKYGGTRMPSQDLTQAQVEAVLIFLEGEGSTGSQAAPVAELPAGDPARGEALFMGNSHFENDGPPCMGCHNVDSKGLLGGGALGPDLTDVSTLYSEAGLAAAMASIPWPTMLPIFNEHPLTPAEQSDLTAFLQTTAGQPAANREWFILGLSLAGFLAALGLTGFIYRGRLRGVRKPLLEQTRRGKP